MISAVICMSLRWVWHIYNLPCISALFWFFSVARNVFRSLRICFWGKKYDVYVAYLHSISWRWARLWLELFASTVDKFLSQVSYLPSYVFLRRRRSFPLRKLYACLEKCVCFLQLIWLSLCFWSLMYKFLSPLTVLHSLCSLRYALNEELTKFLRPLFSQSRFRNLWTGAAKKLLPIHDFPECKNLFGHITLYIADNKHRCYNYKRRTTTKTKAFAMRS